MIQTVPNKNLATNCEESIALAIRLIDKVIANQKNNARLTATLPKIESESSKYRVTDKEVLSRADELKNFLRSEEGVKIFDGSFFSNSLDGIKKTFEVILPLCRNGCPSGTFSFMRQDLDSHLNFRTSYFVALKRFEQTGENLIKAQNADLVNLEKRSVPLAYREGIASFYRERASAIIKTYQTLGALYNQTHIDYPLNIIAEFAATLSPENSYSVLDQLHFGCSSLGGNFDLAGGSTGHRVSTARKHH